MPQTMTLNISSKIDKGPSIGSEAKFDVTTYAAIVEETVNKCTSCNFELPTFKADGKTQILITADKYAVDKDPATASGVKCTTPPDKYITYQLSYDPIVIADGTALPEALLRPVVLIPTTPDEKHHHAKGINNIAFKNDLTINVKVSVLVYRLP